MTDSHYVPGAGICFASSAISAPLRFRGQLRPASAGGRGEFAAQPCLGTRGCGQRGASAPTEPIWTQYVPKAAHVVNRVGSTRRLRSNILSAAERAYARSCVAPAHTSSTNPAVVIRLEWSARAAGWSGRYRYKAPNPACPITVDGASLRVFGSENSTRLRPSFFAT
jgi:hypothetical protein